MERRLAMKNAALALGGVMAVGGTQMAMAQAGKKGAAVAKRKPFDKLSDALSECIDSCEVCIEFCRSQMASGETMMADCFKKCLELVPVCESLRTLSNYGSELTAAQAKVSRDACKACAEACKPHIEHHSECKACYEDCLKCAEECSKL